MFLPLYATLLMVLFTICSFARTRHSVLMTARHEAWMQQAKYGKETESLSHFDTGADGISIILNGEQDASSGLISGHQQKDATLYLKTLQTITNSQSDHFVVTDPWDHRVLHFEVQREHSRLTMGDRIPVFGNVNRPAFTSLLSAFDASPQVAARQMQSIQNSRSQASTQASRLLANLRREITQLEQSVSSLENQLETARNQTPPNTSEIASLTEQLRASQDKLQTTKNYAARINEMNQLIESL